MLVCSVVLRPQGHVVAAAIVEAAGAFDVLAPGAIFATLTDDPGDARDILDAFKGQFMVEAANAVATVNAGLAHPAFVLEEISAAVSTQNATIGAVGSLTPRNAMLDGTYVNSNGTARQANVGGTMVNL